MAGPRKKKLPEHKFPTPAPVEPKKGLDVKVKVDKSESGRITVTVTLLNDGVEIASDYDFVNV
jgi:hypothetical protein